MNSSKTLMDRLKEVDSTSIEGIVKKLLAINEFKISLKNIESSKKIYEKIYEYLRAQFDLIAIEFTILSSEKKKTFFVEGKISDFNYSFESVVAKDIKLLISLQLPIESIEYDIILNSYFNELIDLIYVRYLIDNLQDSSFVDQLTQLKNRMAFNEEIKLLIPLAIREKMTIGVLLINIDTFHAVNDEHGDQFGDQFLQLYAKTIKSSIRTSDLAIRFGGGEFLVLLINIDKEDRVLEIANKIQSKLSSTYLLTKNNDKFSKTACIGVSIFPDDSTDINSVVKNAEIALTKAKESGRGQVRKFKEESTIELF